LGWGAELAVVGNGLFPCVDSQPIMHYGTCYAGVTTSWQIQPETSEGKPCGGICCAWDFCPAGGGVVGAGRAERGCFG
jgi:hypothetical protein